MKFVPVTLLFQFLLSVTFVASGQFVSMPTTIKTPMGNVPSTHYVYRPMHNFNYASISLTHKYEIVLKNDSVISKRAIINIDDSIHSITIKGAKFKKLRITPSETKHIVCLREYQVKLTGTPTDSCWLFKVTVGAINGYSPLPEADQNLTALQHGDTSAIIALTKENLIPLVSDEPKALALAQNGQLGKALLFYNKKKRANTRN